MKWVVRIPDTKLYLAHTSEDGFLFCYGKRGAKVYGSYPEAERVAELFCGKAEVRRKSWRDELNAKIID